MVKELETLNSKECFTFNTTLTTRQHVNGLLSCGSGSRCGGTGCSLRGAGKWVCLSSSWHIFDGFLSICVDSILSFALWRSQVLITEEKRMLRITLLVTIRKIYKWIKVVMTAIEMIHLLLPLFPSILCVQREAAICRYQEAGLTLDIRVQDLKTLAILHNCLKTLDK